MAPIRESAKSSVKLESWVASMTQVSRMNCAVPPAPDVSQYTWFGMVEAVVGPVADEDVPPVSLVQGWEPPPSTRP